MTDKAHDWLTSAKYVLPFILAFLLFILFWNNHLDKEAREELIRHAEIIQDDLWNFDAKDMETYLALAARANRYESIIVFDDQGEEFVHVAGPPTNTTEEALYVIGLISKADYATDVIHEGKVIGRVTARQIQTPIYLYVNLALVIFLIGLAERYLLKSLREIKIRRQAENELRNQRDLSDSLINTAPAIILVLDKDARIVRINPFFESLTGYSLPEIK